MAKNKIQRIDQEIAKEMCIRDRVDTVWISYCMP